MIKNGRIVIEVEKDKKNAAVRVENLSLGDICNVMGAVLNDIIIDNTDSKIGEAFFKACAIRDICNQIGLTETAEGLDEILRGKFKRQRVKRSVAGIAFAIGACTAATAQKTFVINATVVTGAVVTAVRLSTIGRTARMNSYIDALKTKYSMSNADYLTLKDLLSGSKELEYNRGYSEGYNGGYKQCIQDVSREQEKLFAQVNGTVDRMESRLREYFEGGQ